jgi:hypothetical protein
MKHRFLVHSLSHTILVVDITHFGIQIETNARPRNTKMIPALRFPVWKEAEQYFRANGADSSILEETRRNLDKAGVAVMTIV